MDLSNIKEIHIEPTSLCNAECPQCARNILGTGLNPNIQLGSLSIDWFKETFTRDNIANIDKIFFCGNVGDPCATPDLLKIVAYLKSIKPHIVLGANTNGSLKTRIWFKELGHLLNGPLDYLVFSIDGLEDTNHIYRRNTVWSKIMENAEAYISTGASAHWDMLVFRHNRHQVDSAQTIARQMGFRWFRSKSTDRWDIYPMGELEPADLYEKPNYQTTKPECEKNRDSSMFIDYTGKVWPCCHMAEAYLNNIGQELHTDIKQFSNTELMTEYQHRLESNPFYICHRACGSNTGKRSQWKQEIQLS
jgi:MoaA/NifB/PqqE/SkfB family radical SAM enzyme